MRRSVAAGGGRAGGADLRLYLAARGARRIGGAPRQGGSAPRDVDPVVGRAHRAADGRLVERAGVLSVDRRARVLGEPARPRADHGADHRADARAARRLQRRVPPELPAQRTRRLPARVRADAPARRVIRGRGGVRVRARTGCRTRSICSSCPPTGCRSRSRHCISTSPRRDGAGPRSSPRAGCCRRSRAATTSSSSPSSSCSGWRGSRPDTSRAASGRDFSSPGSPPRACSLRCSSGTDRSTPSTASSGARSRSSTTAPTSRGCGRSHRIRCSGARPCVPEQARNPRSSRDSPSSCC